MVEASEENAYELLKIETMKRNNVRMIELGLPPLRLLGEDTLVKGKKAVKSPLATKIPDLHKVRTSQRQTEIDKMQCPVSEGPIVTFCASKCGECQELFPSENSRFCSSCGTPRSSNRQHLSFNDQKIATVANVPKGEGCINLEELYDRIFKKPPPHSKGKYKWGRQFLRDHHPLQWKTYNENVKRVRSWFSDLENPEVKILLNSNLRKEKEMVDKVKDYIKVREPSLGGLLFLANGSTACVRWKVDDIYQWFKEFKHYFTNKEQYGKQTKVQQR